MRIGELADRFELNTKTIRYYESIGLLPEPTRTDSGYRDYAEADAERLGFIRHAQRLGLRLDDIREIMGFRERDERPCHHVVDLIGHQVDDLAQRIAEMTRLREELVVLHKRAERLAGDGGAFCPIIEHQAPVT